VAAAVSAANLTLAQQATRLPLQSSLVDFQTCRLPLVNRHWQNPRHEKIYPTDYNSVSDVDRSSLICANYRLIARYLYRLFGSFNQPAGSAGDDETNDGAVEVE
jgi:hypothetical protein